jgi:hypothetical protein
MTLQTPLVPHTIVGMWIALALGCTGEPTVDNTRPGAPGWGAQGRDDAAETIATGGIAEATGGDSLGGNTDGGGATQVGPGSGGRTALGGYPGGRTGSGGSSGDGGRAGFSGIMATGGTSGVGGRTGAGGSAALGGTTGSSETKASGGTVGSGGSIATGGSASAGSSATGGSSATFDWGTTTYNSSGGASVTYQGHYTGQGCVGTACHKHTFSFGGTVYQSNGTTTAGNVQIGILMNGALTTTYSGKQGNFFGSSGSGWSTAQIAIRTDSGTLVMPTNASASGNCNGCHSAANRIVAQ